MSDQLRGLSIKLLQVVRTIEGILYLVPALGCYAGILYLTSTFGLNLVTAILNLILVAQGTALVAKATEKFASMPEAPPPEDRRRYLGNKAITQRTQWPERERRSP
jgi:hypothetical protein